MGPVPSRSSLGGLGRRRVLEQLFFLLTLCAADDGAIMSKLNATISGTSWSGSNYCNWNGIECDYSGRVTEIQLGFKSLSGTLPAELNQFTHLIILSLEANYFSGELPYLSNLTSLEALYLHANNFTSIPPGFFLGFKNLQTFSIEENIDLAPWSIPADLISCRSLVYFSGMQSSLTGPIPDIFDSLPHLEYLNLSENNLTGPIPQSLTNLTQLQVIDVSNNNLSGLVPIFRPGVTFKSSGNFFLDDGVSLGTSGSGSSGLTPTGNSTGASNNGGSGSVSQGMIVGIVFSVIVFVGIVLVVFHKYCRLKRQHQRFRGIENPENGEMVIPSMVARCTLRRRWVAVDDQLELQTV